MSIRQLIPSPIRRTLRYLLTKVQRAKHFLALLWTFSRGYWTFLRTGSTPTPSYYSLRELYCLTNGRFHKFVGSLSGILHPPYRIPVAQGVLGNLAHSDVKTILSVLKERGYYIFDHKLPDEICDELLKFALTTPAQPLYTKSTNAPQSNAEHNGQLIYDRHNPVAVWYQFDVQRIYENPAVQLLAADLSILAVAQAYLRCRPIQDMVTMWWSTSLLKGVPESDAAQLYHIDMDRVRFINFFIYLTDVTSETGPHCYIAKSNNHKPRALCRDGRISDQEIAQHYGPDAFVELTGPKGTMMLVDTTGFHKGKAARTGDRLMLQILFATSMFGQNYSRVKVNDKFSKRFLEHAMQFKRTFSNLETT